MLAIAVIAAVGIPVLLANAVASYSWQAKITDPIREISNHSWGLLQRVRGEDDHPPGRSWVPLRHKGESPRRPLYAPSRWPAQM